MSKSVNLRFHPEARAEFDEATDYYTDAQPGLGEDFVVKVASALDRVCAAPERWPLWPSLPRGAPQIRRVLVKRFPYGIAYEYVGDAVVVLAVPHLRRRPLYWLSRTSTERAG
jgi:toxin ParE1/3/4